MPKTDEEFVLDLLSSEEGRQTPGTIEEELRHSLRIKPDESARNIFKNLYDLGLVCEIFGSISSVLIERRYEDEKKIISKLLSNSPTLSVSVDAAQKALCKFHKVRSRDPVQNPLINLRAVLARDDLRACLGFDHHPESDIIYLLQSDNKEAEDERTL